MISYIRGELIAIEEGKVIVDVGGVGYGIYMPETSIQCMPSFGEEVKIHTYMNVREDAIQLFGFLTRDDLYIFKLLIGVSGIGPKGGLSILSHLSADELRFAVMSHDIKSISGSQGIGKKMAEKLIIELHDKLSVEDILERTAESSIASVSGTTSTFQVEAIQALVALGYSNSEALKAVKNISTEETSAEGILKQALKYLI